MRDRYRAGRLRRVQEGLREAKESSYGYLIQGQGVATGVIPFLISKNIITGSSVSTAITAGFSSLILTCDLSAKPGKNYMVGAGKDRRYHPVKTYLYKTGSTEEGKLLLFDKFYSLADVTKGL
ncbi:hypothetical protein F5B21DRAFT_506906 [Xylaria acuta]|nr:hypothetical protein F5B21DRAFT_506906 [Xylaria acuta]